MGKKQSKVQHSAPPPEAVQDFVEDAEEVERCVSETYGNLLSPPKLLWSVCRCDGKTDNADLVPTDCAFLPNGHLLVTNMNKQRPCLEVYDQMGKLVRKIGHDIFKPKNVMITKKGTIAVTDCRDKNVKFFTPEGKLIDQWKAKKFNFPCGIGETKDGKFVIADSDANSVTLHNRQGELVGKLNPKLAGHKNFKYPCYVVVDKKNNIIFSDSGNHCVHVYMGHNLLHLRQINTYEHNDWEANTNPNGICTDWYDNIIIADWINRDRMVSLCTRDGEVLTLLHKDEVQSPHGVAFDTNSGRLAVAEYSSVPNLKPCLKVFQMYKYLPKHH
ncbi:tripartite motif-containing protein 3-like [Lineus longissimus]|uniref:tripartite motif-containing protein 3-like n=1 Tax=Lineus longissimus TaxID=88925 RepID=UPI00315DCF25